MIEVHILIKNQEPTIFNYEDAATTYKQVLNDLKAIGHEGVLKAVVMIDHEIYQDVNLDATIDGCILMLV